MTKTSSEKQLIHPFPTPLLEGKFIKRYKRFFADFKLDGKVQTAHVANTGSLKGCLEEGVPCRVSKASDPNRKLQYSLEMLKTPSSWVGINTSLPAKLVHQLWQEQLYKPWTRFDKAQMEIKINEATRLDMVMWKSRDYDQEKLNWKELKPPLHFIEIKNVTLSGGSQAQFPDSVTERGQKHLIEMMDLIDQGYTCELVFLIQRNDCTSFAPADDIDPEYGKLLRKAKKKGVLITPFSCELTAMAAVLNPIPLPVNL